VQVYSQQQEIAEELRRIRALTKSAGQLAARQRAAVDRVDGALRDLGDAENYMCALAPFQRGRHSVRLCVMIRPSSPH
jgi:hypothetical protein